jgi:hypothetical protein
MSTGGQGLTPAEDVGRGFILRSAPPAERAVSQPHQMEIPIQCIMPGKKFSQISGTQCLSPLTTPLWWHNAR